MTRRHALTDEQWTLVEPIVPKSTARTGRPAKEPRLMLDGIFWILATGAPWRDLPERFGPWQSVYHYFRTWRDGGVFARVVQTLQIKLDNEGLIDHEIWSIDGSNVRAARAAAGAAKKVSPATTASPPTMRWAAAGAASAPSSTSSPTAGPRRSPSTSPPARRTSRRVSNR